MINRPEDLKVFRVSLAVISKRPRGPDQLTAVPPFLHHAFDYLVTEGMFGIRFADRASGIADCSTHTYIRTLVDGDWLLLLLMLLVVDVCLYCTGIPVTGLFRLSGAADKLAELRAQLDSGEDNPFWKGVTDHSVQASTVADLIGFYFRELPEPIIPAKLYVEFLAIACMKQYNGVWQSVRCMIDLV
jgi:hypothetical protein